MLDSIQRPYNFQGSPNDLFRQFINNHNSQVEEKKQFQIRNVDVPDNNNYINRENSNYSNTWDSVNDKLINTNGGNLETGPLENGKRYIDFIAEYKHINSQTIQFGENLLDITQYIKGENIKTAIIPLGAKNEETKEKLTISSVNNGKDYIFDETAVKLFGWIWGTVEYEDVTIAQNLLTKAKSYLDSVINESITIELSAVDLHHLNSDIEKFKKGDLVRVISIPHKLDTYFQVSKLSLNLDDPKSSILTLGKTFTTLTEKQIKDSKILKENIMINMQNIEKNTQDIKNNEQNIEKNAQDIKNNEQNIEKNAQDIKKTAADIEEVKENVEELNKTVSQIPNNYVSNDTFNKYQEDIDKKISNIPTVDLSGYLKEKDANSKFASLEKFQNLVSRVETLEERLNGLGGIV